MDQKKAGERAGDAEGPARVGQGKEEKHALRIREYMQMTIGHSWSEVNAKTTNVKQKEEQSNRQLQRGGKGINLQLETLYKQGMGNAWKVRETCKRREENLKFEKRRRKCTQKSTDCHSDGCVAETTTKKNKLGSQKQRKPQNQGMRRTRLNGKGTRREWEMKRNQNKEIGNRGEKPEPKKREQEGIKKASGRLDGKIKTFIKEDWMER